jgi:molybdate transport system substrate-binding protein
MSARSRRLCRRAGAVIAAAAWTGLLAGCGSSSAGSGTPGASSPGTVSGTVTVYAAASLKEAFTTLGTEFEAAHPGTTVVLSFGPSSGLATQITEGAPADVFASASVTNMDQVVTAGDAANPTSFAANTLEIAVPPDNPAGIHGLADLGRPGVQVALCQPAVPCGAVATTVLAKAGVTVTAASQETDVKAVLTKVALGEVDAGLVYVTDIRAAGSRVRGIEIPAGVNASTEYPIAVLSAAPNRPAAEAFTAYVLSDRGTSVLGTSGFARP